MGLKMVLTSNAKSLYKYYLTIENYILIIYNFVNLKRKLCSNIIIIEYIRTKQSLTNGITKAL